MEPLSIEQLESLGFEISYKKKKGQKVFDCAYFRDWKMGDLVGVFYSLPSFYDIIEQIANSAKEKEKQRIAEKFAEKMFD